MIMLAARQNAVVSAACQPVPDCVCKLRLDLAVRLGHGVQAADL